MASERDIRSIWSGLWRTIGKIAAKAAGPLQMLNNLRAEYPTLTRSQAGQLVTFGYKARDHLAAMRADPTYRGTASTIPTSRRIAGPGAGRYYEYRVSIKGWTPGLYKARTQAPYEVFIERNFISLTPLSRGELHRRAFAELDDQMVQYIFRREGVTPDPSQVRIDVEVTAVHRNR